MIQLSPAAASEIQRVQSKAANPDALFRLAALMGGCADWYYSLSLSDQPEPDDRVFDCQGIRIAVAAQSWPYLDGLQLDYSEDLMGGGFRFHNPNATKSCGCGNSFSVSASADQIAP
jgi:iron-sulfur cluster assembly accessory protein